MVPLESLEPGQTGLVRALNGGRGFMARMAALGFTPGVLVQMVRNYHAGPLIVALRGTRVALGQIEAGNVWVHPLEANGDALSAA